MVSQRKEWLVTVAAAAFCIVCIAHMATAEDSKHRKHSAPAKVSSNATAGVEILDEQSFGGEVDRSDRAQRKADKKKKERSDKPKGAEGREAGSKDKPKNEDDDNYHVKYETKFAFQNVDEFGLKVKYNKTEHVFYGDTIGINGTGAGGPGGISPTPETRTCVDPSGVVFQVGEFNDLPGACSLRKCESSGIFNPVGICEYPLGKRCEPDVSKVFPDCCECGAAPYNAPPPQMNYVGVQAPPIAGAERPGYQMRTDGSIAPLVGEDSLEMIECRKMNFLDYEYEKPIEGMCIMCYRGQGTYRYIQGCQRMDCDAFLPTDPTAPFPDCCPACVGERVIEADNSSSVEAEDTIEDNLPPDNTSPDETRIRLSYAEPDQYSRRLKNTMQAKRRKF